ncbi:MAG: Fe-S cluster assembly protein SufB [Nanoarchaeota archaeon]
MGSAENQVIEINRERYDHFNPENLKFKAEVGVSEELVRQISLDKNEPEWMLNKRLLGLKTFSEKTMPNWGPSLDDLDLETIHFYMRPDAAKNSRTWDDVPKDIRETYEKLGIPKAEREALAGVGAQYESEIIYHNLKKEWEDKGVVFLDMDEAVHKFPELVQKYFMNSCVPINLHKFTALHVAVWSGGTFIYIPKNVKVEIPLQAYFRMNAKKGGQFEHTLIIADENSQVHYIEGCSAPQYSENSLHAGCVEIHVLKNARVRYTSIENWSKNVYNLNTKRARVSADGIIEWVNGNLGCLSGDTKIFTKNGIKEIENITSGDKVYVWDEKTNSIQESIVKSKIFSGDKRVYKLEAGGREIEASSNHPFLTLTRKKNKMEHKKGFFIREWKQLEGLKVGDIIGISKKLPHQGKSYNLPKIKIGNVVKSNNQYSKFKMQTSHLYNKNITYPKETDEEFMWLMGLILGDGHIDLKQNKINIATHQTEDYRGELINLLDKLFNYKVTEKKERYIIINSRILCQLFSEIDFGGNADTKKIPKWVFGLPENQILSFLAGYIDSDGHISGNGLYITSINKRVLEDVKLLGIQLGLSSSRVFKHGIAKVIEIMGIKANSKDSWRILLFGEKIRQIPLKCKRKKDKLIKLNSKRKDISSKGMNFKSKANEEIGFVRINRIEEIGIKPTFDIEVQDYSNFIANGLIVHNSKVTMLYPCSMLIGEGARSDYIGIAYAGSGQYQDTGCKVHHLAPNTSSVVLSKGISKNGGTSSYRGLIEIKKGCKNVKSSVSCDGLMMDNESRALTFPSMDVKENDVKVSHEATIGRIGEEQLFYLMSRGLTQEEATKMIVSGFIEPVIKHLPLEYAAELNHLIDLEIENSVS